MFIIDPDPYLLPAYRISPFRTADIAINNKLTESDLIDVYFDNRFGTNKYNYVPNGRSAIHQALAHYDLAKNDVVTILTTTNNFYISNCVTSEIEKFCSWSREITDKTKLIFVNHEFGHPYEELKELGKYNLPIIEDCAHSFFSRDSESIIGTIGDFVIYSFPKMFPIQIGGLLVTNKHEKVNISSNLDNDSLAYLKKVLSYYIPSEKSIIKKRIEAYNFLNKELNEFGFTQRFELKQGIVPGVFMFKVNNETIDLGKLKIYLWEHGIHCSVFYGERAFFIPCHQNLSKDDMFYFKAIIESFLKNEL